MNQFLKTFIVLYDFFVWFTQCRKYACASLRKRGHLQYVCKYRKVLKFEIHYQIFAWHFSHLKVTETLNHELFHRNKYLTKKFMTFRYRISANSFHGNYSFLNLTLCTVTFEIRQSLIYSSLVAGTMVQMNRQPSVWCSKYYFFSWFLAKYVAKSLSIHFIIFFTKLLK